LKEGDQMAARFSQDQKLISECVKILIELYRVEENNHDIKTLWKPESVGVLERLLRIIFGDCNYDKDIRKYYTNTKCGKKGIVFSIDEITKSTFLGIMDLLWSNLFDEVRYHFGFVGIETKSITEFRDEPFKSPRRLINFAKWRLAHHAPITQEGQTDLYKIRNIAFSTLIGKYKNEIKSLTLFAIEHKKYNIAAITKFAQYLLEEKPIEKPLTTIPDPFLPQNNLIRLVRAILVKFHIVFGDYSRVKVCKNCENLFF
jgi:hypothetical protein